MRARTLVLLALAACYDSRWGEGERIAKHNAEHLTPAALSAAPASSQTPKIARTYHLRVLATQHYTAQTLDWKNDFAEIVDGANKVLGPGFGVKLDVESASLWQQPGSGSASDTGAPPEDQLDAALGALRESDDGKDVDWIVGLVGGLSKYTASFHQLGLGELPGRYVVMRAATDLKEFDAVDKTLAELSPEERAEVVHARRRHRSVVVFLHELAHTLGAVHEGGKDSILFPAYDANVSSFGPSATALLDVALPHRADPLDAPSRKAFLQDVLADYEKEPGDWLADEREAMIARLRATLGVAPAAPKTSSSASAAAPPPVVAPPDLKPADAAKYKAAMEAFQAGKYGESRDVAQPLFDAYPNVFSVQDLRCQLAMKQNLPWQQTKAECALLMKLSTKK